MEAERTGSLVLGNDWKTTIVGFLAAVSTAIVPLLENGEWPSTERLLTAIAVALLGRFSRLSTDLGAKSLVVLLLAGLASSCALYDFAQQSQDSKNGGVVDVQTCEAVRGYIEMCEKELASASGSRPETASWFRMALDAARLEYARKCGSSR